jgi:hypothetical protein
MRAEQRSTLLDAHAIRSRERLSTILILRVFSRKIGSLQFASYYQANPVTTNRNQFAPHHVFQFLALSHCQLQKACCKMRQRIGKTCRSFACSLDA